MLSNNYFLVLSLLSVNILPSVTSFPLSARELSREAAEILAPRIFTPSVAPKISLPNKTPPKNPKKPKERGDGVDPDVGHSNPFEAGAGGDSKSGSEERSRNNVGDGSSDCSATNPLPLRFAQRFQNGHGCKIIAGALDDSSSPDPQFFCRGENHQAASLCDGRPYFDQHLADCLSFLSSNGNRQFVRALEGYRGVCAAHGPGQ